MSLIRDESFDPAEWETSGEITILSPNGFHARPAAILVKTAKKFSSEIKLLKGDASANAKSLVAVMGFALRKGDTLEAVAKGPDSKEAITALVPIITGEIEKALSTHGGQNEKQERGVSNGKNIFKGITASPGVAIGVAKHVARGEIRISENAEGSPADEERILRGAMERAKSQLRIIEDDTKAASDAEHSAIFGAHIELLEDPELLEYALKLISIGHSAAYAWNSSCEAHAKRFRNLGSELFAERASDLEDVGRRVLRILTGTAEEAEFPENGILLAVDLSPSDAAISGGRALGFCTIKGGEMSHVSILARSLGLPALVGADESILSIPDGAPLVLNADEGILTAYPGAEESGRIALRQAEMTERRARDARDAAHPAITLDGTRIDVAANIAGVEEAARAKALGCDGVGLLRSEFLFLGRGTAPGEEELAEAYTAIARAIGKGKPLVVRTMDIGGDKSAPYIRLEEEDNPFLGTRGLRLSLRMKDLFAAQIRAILSAAEFCDLHIMFPMVSTLEEFREAKSIVLELRKEMEAPEVKIGLMAEVPSSAILARHFAAGADFMSLGTNDLTQYTMAADRGNPKLAQIADSFNPSVFHMIKSVTDGARGQNCWVGVCGGLAEDPLAVPALIGFGVDELSVSVPAIPQIKSRVRSLSKADCEQIATGVLGLATAAEVREYLKTCL